MRARSGRVACAGPLSPSSDDAFPTAGPKLDRGSDRQAILARFDLFTTAPRRPAKVLMPSHFDRYALSGDDDAANILAQLMRPLTRRERVPRAPRSVPQQTAHVILDHSLDLAGRNAGQRAPAFRLSAQTGAADVV